MDEDFLDVTASSKKTILIFIFILVLLGVFGYLFVFKNLYFSVKTVKVELGSELSTDVKDYLSKSSTLKSNYVLDINKVNPNIVGTYTYTVTQNNTTKTGKIIVQDTTAPEFTLTELTIEEGADYYLGNFLESCTDLSMPCLVNLKNKKDESLFSKIGTHTVEIEVKDLYGNGKSAFATLNVLESGTYVDPRTKDLEFAKDSRGNEEFNEVIYIKLDSAIEKDSEEAYGKLSEITSAIDLEAYVKDNYGNATIKASEIIELYNKSDFVIGYAIEITLSNNKVIYVDASKVEKSIEEEEE